MNTNLQCFNFGEEPVRILDRDNEPWFVAADVCRVLEIANSRDAVTILDEDEKGVGITDTLGGTQAVSIISESGLYTLIFKSRKPQARKFRKWVTFEVLPTIRKTGGYSVGFTAGTIGAVFTALLGALARSVHGLLDGSVSIGSAQQIANSARVFLEVVKTQGEALGYEKVLNLPAS